MQQNFQILIQSRKNVLKLVEKLNSEQLNNIPQGFSNNVVWNLGHLLVSQQLLCYRLAGLDCGLPKYMIEKYQKGSAPQGRVEENEIALIKSKFVQLAEKMEADYNKNLFKEYNPYLTSANIKLNSIEEAIVFNTYHDGIHLGILLQILKFV